MKTSVNSHVVGGYKNWSSKMKFFGAKEFFSPTLISKIGLKMNLRIIMKTNAADPEIRFLAKSISKPNGRRHAGRVGVNV